jgi:hypothetical protein
MPSEALRIFAQTIYEKGVSMAQVTRMITDNPMQLLDAEAEITPSEADLAWARSLVEDPCTSLPATQPYPSAASAPAAPAPAAPALARYPAPPAGPAPAGPAPAAPPPVGDPG